MSLPVIELRLPEHVHLSSDADGMDEATYRATSAPGGPEQCDGAPDPKRAGAVIRRYSLQAYAKYACLCGLRAPRVRLTGHNLQGCVTLKVLTVMSRCSSGREDTEPRVERPILGGQAHGDQ
jgi:hypothetical protein